MLKNEWMRGLCFREMPEVLDEAEAFAKSKGISMADVMRWALRDFLCKNTKHALKPGEDLNDDRHQHRDGFSE